nr:hypothetical protein [Marinicella sp. W31]MDC2876765.1 hypothetical protein [Marinicella sp. W31]
MASIHLPDRALITLDGEDTEAFLQNLITTNIEGIAPVRPGPARF